LHVFFVFTTGCAFIGIYINKTCIDISNGFPGKSFNSLQYLLAPGLFMSILYFVKPTKRFRKTDWFNFIPFAIYVCAENIWQFGKECISTYPLFNPNKIVSFLVRDMLPFLTIFNLVKS